jgi:bzd-type benzoyl-CoA reductase Q subunit
MSENKTEFWRWEESRWTNSDIVNPQKGLITAGLDIGSTSTQAVLTVDGELYAYSNIRTGSDSPESANQAMAWALEGTGLELSDVKYTVGTGYGRVNVPFADKCITEITCHARGANIIYGPTVRTILDMGGQDCKAIHCDEKGRVMSFMMNDKCAAGTGRGMEAIANLLGVNIGDIGDMALDTDEEPEPISSLCVVFAKVEVANLMRSGWTKQMVLASYCRAMAIRVSRLLIRNGMKADFAITGGIAKNKGVVKHIETILDVKALDSTKYDTQIAGALGAALIAKDMFIKKQNRLG